MTPSERKTILIVEDDRDAREALSEFLNLNGYTVACAVNGQDAINQIDKRMPGLILLDLMMPVMDGKAFLAFARHNRQLEKVPVIITTAHPSQAASCGAAAVVAKPIKPERLLSLLGSFLPDS